MKNLKLFTTISEVVFFMVIIMALCSCVTGNGSGDSRSETGYPSGTLQQQYLFYHGTRYIYSGGLLTEQSGLTEVGKVLKVDNENLPDEEWEAAHLAIGTKVYIRAADYKKMVYTERPDKNGYEVFVLDNEESPEETDGEAGTSTERTSWRQNNYVETEAPETEAEPAE